MNNTNKVSKYRILYIESGDYLYGYTGNANLFSSYEVEIQENKNMFSIYEATSEYEAKNRLNGSADIKDYKHLSINSKIYETVFEIVEGD